MCFLTTYTCKSNNIGNRFEQLTSDLEAVDANNTPDLDKQAGALRKNLDETEMSAALNFFSASCFDVV